MYMSCDVFSQSHMECLYLVLVLVCSVYRAFCHADRLGKVPVVFNVV